MFITHTFLVTLWSVTKIRWTLLVIEVILAGRPYPIWLSRFYPGLSGSRSRSCVGLQCQMWWNPRRPPFQPRLLSSQIAPSCCFCSTLWCNDAVYDWMDPPPPSDDATAFFGKQQRYLMWKRQETIVFFIVHIYRKRVFLISKMHLREGTTYHFSCFLAVQNSSIGDLVTHWLTDWLTESLTNSRLLLPYKEQS